MENDAFSRFSQSPLPPPPKSSSPPVATLNQQAQQYNNRQYATQNKNVVRFKKTNQQRKVETNPTFPRMRPFPHPHPRCRRLPGNSAGRRRRCWDRKMPLVGASASRADSPSLAPSSDDRPKTCYPLHRLPGNPVLSRYVKARVVTVLEVQIYPTIRYTHISLRF